MQKPLLAGVSALVVASLTLSSCNVFDPLDSPSGDAQLLSAARACFDRGDYECARENYGKLSGSQADIANSEQAFLTLDEQGASMAAYMEFVGNLGDKGTGKALTVFANRLTGSAGAAKRVAIWQVFHDANTGISNTSLKSFVRFVAATALVAEIFAEAARDRTELLPADLAATAGTCQSAGQAGCTGAASCNVPSGATLVTDASGISITGDSAPSNTNPTMSQLYDSVDQALTSLQALGPSGKFSNTSNAFQAIKDAVNTAGGTGTLNTANGAVDRCFREDLLELGVGTT